jgi:hypothetical protein
METLQAILLALVGAFAGIVVYKSLYSKSIQKDSVEVIQEVPNLPYWTTYDPGFGYWPRQMGAYWLQHVPFYGPITGSAHYRPWYSGRPLYLPNHWSDRHHGYSGVAVGGGGSGMHH